MISRVADYCFWFGRYLERAEATSSVTVVTRNLALDGDMTPRQCWVPLLHVCGVEPAFTERFGPDAAEDGEIVEEYMTWAPENLSSIHSSVSAIRENARCIRELISLDVWVTVNELYQWVKSDAARLEYAQRRYDFYRRIRETMQLCLGTLRGTMLHDTPLNFIWLGVLLERANQTARTLDTHHHAMMMLASTHPVLETSMWLSLLRVCSGFEPFMQRSRGKVSGQAVAAFLILEGIFPRSIKYCVHSAFERLCVIRPPEARELPGGRALERLRVLDRWLSEQTSQTLAPSDAVHEVLTHVVDETQQICEELGRELLGHGTEGNTVARTAPQ